ncbi:retrovirus-related pol polyprotein from transposon TNT 1-94 [Tanacetum coccineum]
MAIGTKWIFRNKKDERGIVIKNKVRLVAQKYTQEEGIDYDEVFALVSRIKAIRLFLSYASFKDILVYQMDVKSDFLYGKIKEEVYVSQPPGFEDPDFPNIAYKVEKVLYGLHQAPRACKHMETQKLLLKDEDGEEVDVHLYRSMIGSLMYLTSSRPDIMFAVCACARYQVNLKISHLHVVKKIIRYLKGQPKLGLWYLKDSPFDLVAYTYSDYARASLDRKSTTGINLLLLLKVNATRHNLQLLIALIMRNKPDIDEINIDDLYNNLRVYKDELKSTVSGDSGVSTAGGINQVPSTLCAHDVAYSFLAQPTTSSQLKNEDFQQMDGDDLEELDL